ncbi:unnamed protein product [Nezara viridula]|uniref:Neuropeptide n=1 Tax=Nezara viridula TaxID=85310 RepID=A0A9P0MKF8_NEZVI|nr:unnamed protein product [Nezara viridula]
MVSVAFAAFLTNMNLLARLCRVPPRSEVEGGGIRPPTSSLEVCEPARRPLQVSLFFNNYSWQFITFVNN